MPGGATECYTTCYLASYWLLGGTVTRAKSTGPDLRGRSLLQLSPGRLYVAAWKLNVHLGEVHIRQEVLMRSRVADAAAFPSCSLLQRDFSRKWLQVGRGDLSAASGKSRVAAWHTLIHKVACMCETPHQVKNKLEPGKKELRMWF